MYRIFAAIVLIVLPASATVVSYVGTLTDPDTDFETTFTLVSASTVTIQTFGYGGGTNGNSSLRSGNHGLYRHRRLCSISRFRRRWQLSSRHTEGRQLL
jgi:hypothetical protein